MRLFTAGYWAGQVLLLASERRVVSSIPVYFAPELRDQISGLASTLHAAIALLARTPVRPRKAIGRYIKRIMIGPLPHIRGEWNDALAMCTLDAGFLSHPNTTVADVVSTLIHEAQHARLARMRVRYNHETRLRVERLCIQAQLDLARHLGDQLMVDQLVSDHREAEHVWDVGRLKGLRQETLERWITEFKLPHWVERIALALIRRRAA